TLSSFRGGRHRGRGSLFFAGGPSVRPAFRLPTLDGPLCIADFLFHEDECPGESRSRRPHECVGELSTCGGRIFHATCDFLEEAHGTNRSHRGYELVASLNVGGHRRRRG